MINFNNSVIFLALWFSLTFPSWAFFVPHPANTIRKNQGLSMASKTGDQFPPYSILPSAYDVSLPAGLRGEAVRSALKSDRGTCIDFTSPDSSVKNVGVVRVSGKGTASFLNNKLSNTFPEKINEEASEYGKGKGIGFDIKVERGLVKEAGLLNSKGRIIDQLTVATFNSGAYDGIEAYMMTSPGHSGSQLFDRLDPLIFPMDGIKLNDMCPTNTEASGPKSKVLTFVATNIDVVQECIKQSVLPLFHQWNLVSKFSFPSNEEQCIRYGLSSENSEEVQIVILEQQALPNCVSRGYTIIVSDKDGLGSKVWNSCVAESNFNGPIMLGPLEYETLRIEGGQPAFMFEMTGSCKDGDDRNTKASPLELHLHKAVDVNKGCYQGQEGVAALLKNKRGLPRSLYSVSFAEEENFYEGQQDEEEYSNHSQQIANETKLPKVGDDLYVLGSNQQIKVGTITSIAERGGTSLPETIGLALVKRASPILKKMEEMDLEIDRMQLMPFDDMEDDGGSGIIMPPPIDPLDGLEIVLENGFTRGQLRVIPSRRLKQNRNLFEVEQWSVFDDGQGDTGAVMGFMGEPSTADYKEGEEDYAIPLPDSKNSDEPIKTVESEIKIDGTSDDEELQAAIIAAKAAADEARRKEQKLAILKERAEEALKRRREAKKAVAKENEAIRKAEKLAMLKKKAEEAMARRQNKQK